MMLLEAGNGDESLVIGEAGPTIIVYPFASRATALHRPLDLVVLPVIVAVEQPKLSLKRVRWGRSTANHSPG